MKKGLYNFLFLLWFLQNFSISYPEGSVGDIQQSLDNLADKLMLLDLRMHNRYVPIKKIYPGQIRFAEMNVRQKVDAAIKDGSATKNEDSYTLRFDEGKSILKLEKALPVIVGPGGQLRLVDGHHDVLSSIRLGATTVPVKLVADLSHLNPDKFWQEASEKNFVYPYNLQRVKVVPLPTDWNALEDDPNRYFAAISARKCEQGKNQDPRTSTGAEYPLWVKVGKDIPFIEFMISDVLTQHGVVYANDMGNDFNDQKLKDILEKAREVLRKNPIKGLRLVPHRTYFTQLYEADGGICKYEYIP